ncbi:MAG: hypothetical protein MHM6MM_006771 [Cercozoa sp. M6MM]
MDQVLRPIEVNEQIFDVQYHPSSSLLAIALLDGEVSLYDVSGLPKQTARFTFHSESCRGLAFSHDGAFLYTIGRDRSIGVIDVVNHTLVFQLKDAHEHPINAVAVFTKTDDTSGDCTDEFLITGDDVGELVLWSLKEDRRQPRLVRRLPKAHSDWISRVLPLPARRQFLVTGADGVLSMWNVDGGVQKFNGSGPKPAPRPWLAKKSLPAGDELLSVALIKHGRKVVTGSTEGLLILFDMRDIGDYCDRIPGHPQSVEQVLPIDESVVLTASSDGIIRVVQIHPHKLLGVVGAHGDLPVEHLCLSHDRRTLASSSHDNTVKFWDVHEFFEEDDEEEEEEQQQQEQDDEEDETAEKMQPRTRPRSRSAVMAESDDDSDSDSDDDSDRRSKRRKQKSQKINVGQATRMARNDFFDDL